MNTLGEISRNLLLISEGDLSIYERATSTFEDTVNRGEYAYKDVSGVNSATDEATVPTW